MIIMLLADGFEEIEALTPLDMLRRAGMNVRTVGIGGQAVSDGKLIRGAHNITVLCDLSPEEVDADKVDMVILPGGTHAIVQLDNLPFVLTLLRTVKDNGRRLAAIGAASSLLGKHGLLRDKRVACCPGHDDELFGAIVVGDDVVTDGNITTARDMTVALRFAEEIVSLFPGERKLDPGTIACLLDQNFRKAVEVAIHDGKISSVLIQRKVSVGYPKAAMYIDAMERLGIVSAPNGSGPRDVIIDLDEWRRTLEALPQTD